MLNKKTILVSGYSRGGTNILWNIFQSHPLVCSPKHEIGAIFRHPTHLKFSYFIKLTDKLGLLNTKVCRQIIDYNLYRYKIKNLDKPFNKYKNEDELYTRTEVAESVLCMKSVDKDILYTNLLLDVYPDMNIVLLVRNGYAIAEGHFRRGTSIKKSAENFLSVGRCMLEMKKKHGRCTIIKFEDILANPFKVSQDLFKFADLEPEKLEKIRLKSKKVVKNSDLHETSFGEKDKKYWFLEDEITQIIDPEINKKQISKLTPEQIREFNSIAGQQLADFGYKRLD